MARNQQALCLQSILDTLPLALACIPWAVLAGSLAIQAGLSPLQAQLMSMLVFAGAAQIAAINLIQLATPYLSILSTVFIISSRHLLYSAVFRPFTHRLGRCKRYALAFLLTDEMFAISEAYRKKNGQFNYAYTLTSGLTFYVIWCLATYAGITLSESMGDMTNMGFEFTVAAIFIALVIPSIQSFPSLIAVLSSAIVIIFTESHGIPNGILLAGITGMTCAFFVDWQRRKYQ